MSTQVQVVREDDAFATITLTRAHRTITLVGVMHVGPEQYWKDTQAELDALEDAGTLIHCEGVGSADVRGMRNRARLSLMRVVTRSVSLWLRGVCGWKTQRVLTYPSSWQRHDLPSDLALGSTTTRKLISVALLALIASPVAAWLLRTGRLTLFDVEATSNDLDVLDARNRYAITQALSACTDVALLWGAAHLPGMVALLEAEGFTVTNVTWRQFWPAGQKPARRHPSAAPAAAA
ncbi:hypothetical protein [Curtobacterium sp. MCSS17_016]|uniref:hypothetical protein n=1 Tax=Curtobacterium sp. MCSS17_016 TaxID=2175644 RepID=UPI0015E887DE|nr:hypothetical protein [Curtobacterium sp. MCSS17_016]WIE81522.1 hypothetical protein DEJ19_019995 [Curtobacterium sp. MCSS17_016]